MKHYTEPFIDNKVWSSLLSDTARDLDKEHLKETQSLPFKKRVSLLDLDNGIEVMPQEIFVGISQVIPVFVAALATDEGCVAIEEPELH